MRLLLASAAVDAVDAFGEPVGVRLFFVISSLAYAADLALLEEESEAELVRAGAGGVAAVPFRTGRQSPISHSGQTE